jgi:hypothetical protein
MTVRGHVFVLGNLFLPLSTNFEGRIVRLELFMLFLLLPYFYLCIYLLYLMSLRFALFVQSLVFCSVFCGPLFVLLSFCFVGYSKTNDFWLQPWYLQTVLAIYNKSSQWFYCHLGTDCPFGAPEYSRYSVGNLMLDLSFLCSVL